MIKFLDLKSVNKRFESEFKKVFDNFLSKGNYILGEHVSELEKEFAEYCGTKYCIGVSNGLDALKLIFEGYKELGLLYFGDEVIVPANTYIATVLAISNCGLKPVLVEPFLGTYNINTTKVKDFITSKTKAILGVHLYGQLYDVDELEEISKENNLLLIEDAAQAHGAKYIDGRKAGNLSNASAFSFYPTKNLGALGDAGAITTNNIKLASIILKLRNYGRSSSYVNDVKGHNCRLDELQAAFLRIKLKCLDLDNKKRQEIANIYINQIFNKSIQLPSYENVEAHVFHLFVIRTIKRNELKAFLNENGIETYVHYPVPFHKQKAYKEFVDCRFPVTEKIHDEVLSLPIYPNLEISSVLKIIDLINSFS